MELKRFIRTKFSALVYCMVVQSKPQPDDSFYTYGHQIDSIVSSLLSPLSTDAIGYKIEDSGILVGCYVIDFDPVTKLPFVAVKLIREVYTDAEKVIINDQIDIWAQKEYPLV